MSPLETMQNDLAGRADSHFPYVSVFVIRPESESQATMIQNNINKALGGLQPKNGKTGAVILVDMPMAKVPHPDAVGPQMELLPMARVIVNPLINGGATGAGLSAEDIVLDLIQLFHDYLDGQINCTLTVSSRPYEPLPEFIKENKIAYDVFFERRLPLANPAKTCGPKITGAAAAVTITCTDGTAQIYYTTDGSYPTLPGGTVPTTATLYAAPFAVAIPTLVRSVAYAPNKQASNLAARTIAS